jgi:hypothetical protein
VFFSARFGVATNGSEAATKITAPAPDVEVLKKRAERLVHLKNNFFYQFKKKVYSLYLGLELLCHH